MTELVNIEGTELSVKEYNGQMVVTLKDIDRVHGKKFDTAKKSFQKHKKHFILGEDYFEMTRKELGEIYSPNEKIIGNPNLTTYLFTESGYLMIVKTFTDDLSWKVQRSLVNAYFALRNQHPAPTSTTAIEEKPTLEFETDWFCINRGKINYICRCYEITSNEYMHHLLEVLGRTYNFDEAKRIYSATTGNWKCRNSEVITYFPQLSDLASKILQQDVDNCATEETP